MGNRDITIESKRIIFALHRIKTDEDKASVLAESARRFTELRSGLWLRLATELLGEEGEQFLRAYSAGLQEWVEALSFYHFLATGTVVNYEQVKGELEWKVGKWSSSPVRPGIAHWERREEKGEEVRRREKVRKKCQRTMLGRLRKRLVLSQYLRARQMRYLWHQRRSKELRWRRPRLQRRRSG